MPFAKLELYCCRLLNSFTNNYFSSSKKISWILESTSSVGAIPSKSAVAFAATAAPSPLEKSPMIKAGSGQSKKAKSIRGLDSVWVGTGGARRRDYP
jgi:hypothetical protein